MHAFGTTEKMVLALEDLRADPPSQAGQQRHLELYRTASQRILAFGRCPFSSTLKLSFTHLIEKSVEQQTW